MNTWSYKSYWFPPIFLWLTDITEAELCFGFYLFKSCCCWTWRGSDTHLSSLNSLYLFWPISVSTIELMSWIVCVRWGRQCWAAPGSCSSRHVLKCDSYNILHACSFEAALIAFLVTSCLNWPRHCMHVVYFVLWYEMIKATFVRASQEHALRAQDRFRTRLSRAWRWSEVEARGTRLKRLQFDVVIKTFCDWINALLVKKKRQK